MTLPPGLQRTELYSQLTKEFLRERMGGPVAPAPTTVPPAMQIELEMIVDRFHQALRNQVRLPFRIEEVQKVLDSNLKNKDEVLRSRFQGPFPENTEQGTLRLLTRPTAFIDIGDRVVGWFFPNAFTVERSEHVYESVKALSRAPKSVLVESRTKRKKKKGNGCNWRDDDTMFRPPADSVLAPGNVVMSICWYNLGWGPHNDRPPAPSAGLRPFGGGPEFVASQCDTNALIGVILSLVHPHLYSLQTEVLKQLREGRIEVEQRQHFERLFEHWSTPFTAFALISNRETPLHRDTRGGKMLFDLLATFGRYGKGRFDIPLFGAHLVYNPSTAILIPGHLLQHGASEVDGERVCMASFFRPNVGYGTLPHYTELLPPRLNDLTATLRINLPADCRLDSSM